MPLFAGGVAGTRLAAFVISGFFVGLAGGLYAHFLGILTVEVFYLNLTFITIAMLVIGGSFSLTGAVVGVVLVTVVTEILRGGEAGLWGVLLNSRVLALPRGSQEIGLGISMALVLVFKPAGLINGREIPFPFFRRSASGRARDIVQVSDHAECACGKIQQSVGRAMLTAKCPPLSTLFH